jgi:hypothetical protein
MEAKNDPSGAFRDHDRFSFTYDYRTLAINAGDNLDHKKSPDFHRGLFLKCYVD